MKKRRIVNEEVLETVRNLVCLACASLDPEAAREAIHDHGIRCHPHHLISKGAGGGDVPENILPVCFKHHSLVHAIGLGRFSQEFKVVHDWLEGAGWSFNGVTWEEPGCVYRKELSDVVIEK